MCRVREGYGSGIEHVVEIAEKQPVSKVAALAEAASVGGGIHLRMRWQHELVLS